MISALLFISNETRRMRRSLRQAEPTPREGCEAGLLLLEAAANEALGKETA